MSAERDRLEPSISNSGLQRTFFTLLHSSPKDAEDKNDNIPRIQMPEFVDPDSISVDMLHITIPSPSYRSQSSFVERFYSLLEACVASMAGCNRAELVTFKEYDKTHRVCYQFGEEGAPIRISWGLKTAKFARDSVKIKLNPNKAELASLVPFFRLFTPFQLCRMKITEVHWCLDYKRPVSVHRFFAAGLSKGHSWWGASGWESVVFGSPSSDYHVLLYNKRLEQIAKFKVPESELPTHWFRAECHDRSGWYLRPWIWGNASPDAFASFNPFERICYLWDFPKGWKYDNWRAGLLHRGADTFWKTATRSTRRSIMKALARSCPDSTICLGSAFARSDLVSRLRQELWRLVGIAHNWSDEEISEASYFSAAEHYRQCVADFDRESEARRRYNLVQLDMRSNSRASEPALSLDMNLAYVEDCRIGEDFNTLDFRSEDGSHWSVRVRGDFLRGKVALLVGCFVRLRFTASQIPGFVRPKEWSRAFGDTDLISIEEVSYPSERAV